MSTKKIIISPDWVVRDEREPVPVPEISYGEFLAETLRAYPADKKCFIDQETGTVLTAGGLLERARTLAAIFLARVPNLSGRDVAVIHAVNSLEYIIAQTAVAFLGIALSPVTIGYKAFELSRQTADCGGTLLFCSREHVAAVEETIRLLPAGTIKLAVDLDSTGQANCPSVTPLKRLFDEWSPKVKPIEVIPHFPVANPREDVALIVSTSGSTGLPKGAAHTHYALLYGQFQVVAKNVSPYSRPCDRADSGQSSRSGADTWFLNYAMAHSSGQMVFIQSLLTGSLTIVNGRATPEMTLKAVQDYKLMWLGINRETAQFMVTAPEDAQWDLPSLKLVVSGGCPLPEAIARQLIARYRLAVIEGYGTTELGFMSARAPTDPYEPHNIGAPARGLEMKIVDLKTGENCPPGKEGEIWARGEGRIKGYLNRPDATQEAFTEDGWYRSGDIGRMNERGQFIIMDRIKELIKYIVSIYPAEIEHVLALHPAVLESVVVPVPQPMNIEHARAYVKLRPGYVAATSPPIQGGAQVQVVTAEDLMEHVAERLADQKRLRGGVVFWTGDIPRVSIGKPDRQFFKRLAKADAEGKQGNGHSGLGNGHSIQRTTTPC